MNEFLKAAAKRVAKPKKEASLEKDFVNYCNTMSCVALKLILLRRAGFPDRTILCGKGRVFFIEFKRKGRGHLKNLSGPQLFFRKVLLSFGFRYYICDTIEVAKTALDDELQLITRCK